MLNGFWCQGGDELRVKFQSTARQTPLAATESGPEPEPQPQPMVGIGIWNQTAVAVEVLYNGAAHPWSPMRPSSEYLCRSATGLQFDFYTPGQDAASGAVSQHFGSWVVTDLSIQHIFVETAASGLPTIRAIVCSDSDPRYQDYRAHNVGKLIAAINREDRASTAQVVCERGGLRLCPVPPYQRELDAEAEQHLQLARAGQASPGLKPGLEPTGTTPTAQILRTTVPYGTAPGQILSVTTPGGNVNFPVPPGCGPSSVVNFCIVPQGVRPGQAILVTAPDGHTLTITVPEGSFAGSVLIMQLPVASPQANAPAADIVPAVLPQGLSAPGSQAGYLMRLVRKPRLATM